jgi:xanthine/uracil/vitamin C permease (AzgA family)
VGLPFGIGLLLALAFLFSIGFTWSVYALGRGLWREPRSRWLALLFGWAIVAALSAIPYVGAVLWVVGAILGLGAMTVAAWRARGGGRHRPGAKMPERLIDLRPEPPQPQPEPMITERAMGEEGSGI